jgi:16S rRNA (cytosine1402-N4)-methyltransferase
MVASYTHQPVLLSEVLEGLAIKPSGIYVDGTFGRGGHAAGILEKLNAQGKLIAIDKDQDAVEAAKKIKDPRLYIFQGSFADIKTMVHEKADGILLDLGVSSPQLENAARGFSFRGEGPLDMRMDITQGKSLKDWLSNVKEEKLYNIIKTYGEEKFAKRIAKAIINERNHLETTTALAEVIAKAHPRWPRDKHPATQTFQALRIWINNELEDLKTALPACLDLLKIGGRLCVISFHSLEDRIVKQFFQGEIQLDAEWKKVPIRQTEIETRIRWVKRKIRPSLQEIKQNPRARSAVLRIVEKMK